MSHHSQETRKPCRLLTVLTILFELDPFQQHVNKELKEKDIQAAASSSPSSQQLKVSAVWFPRKAHSGTVY